MYLDLTVALQLAIVKQRTPIYFLLKEPSFCQKGRLQIVGIALVDAFRAWKTVVLIVAMLYLVVLKNEVGGMGQVFII